MESLTGKSFGHYQVIEQLGEGGMATVYKARDTNLEREVAVKIIRREAFPAEQTDQLLKRFEREAKALAQLVHPNIVNVIDYGSQEGNPYLVMNYLPGGTLKQKMGKSMPWQEAAHLLLPIAEALDYAHSHNIIHRDVKPSNILLTQRGQPMLTDFGIAKILEGGEGQTLTGTGMGIGTPEYMAPEQWSGKVSPQTDIYALGVVFYELVTGHRPYTANTPAEILLKQAMEPLPRAKSYVSDLPEKVEAILEKAMAKDPADRYATMQDFAQALEDLWRRAEIQQTALNQTGAAPKPTAIEAESTLVDLPSDVPSATLIAPVEESPRPRMVISWKLWTAAAVIMVLIGVGVVFGDGLFKAAKPGEKPTTLPIAGAATNTSLPTLVPSKTETPVPSSTPLPNATATPLLHLGQSLVSSVVYNDLFTIAFSSDERTVSSGAIGPLNGVGIGTDTITVYTFYLDTLDLVNSYHIPLPSMASFITGFMESGGQMIACGFNDGSVILYKSDGSTLKTLSAGNARVDYIKFSAESQTLAVAYGNYLIRLYKIPTGNLLYTLQEPKASALSLAFSPDGLIMASGDSDNMVRLWRVSDGSLLQTLKADSFPSAVAFSPDGGILASGHEDGTIRLWRVSDGSLQNSLTENLGRVTSLAFSPDGQLLASGSYDKTVRVWRVTGSLLETLRGHTFTINSVAFTPGGQLLVSTSADGTVRLWGVLP